MSTIAQPEIACRVIGGVDTHKDQHVAAALDHVGRLLGVAEFPATAAGYRDLHGWLAGHGEAATPGSCSHSNACCSDSFPPSTQS